MNLETNPDISECLYRSWIIYDIKHGVSPSEEVWLPTPNATN